MLRRSKDYLDHPELYPGVAKGNAFRARYYAEKLGGRPVPEFPDGIETRRVTYIDVDIFHGPKRGGGTGMITKMEPPYCCSLLDRLVQKNRKAKSQQDYWLNNLDKRWIPQKSPPSLAIELVMAAKGVKRWVSIPMEYIPYPDPLVIETRSDFEDAHGAKEEGIIDFGGFCLPRGLNKLRTRNLLENVGSQNNERFMEMKIQGGIASHEDFAFDGKTTVGVQRTIQWLKSVARRLKRGGFNPNLFFAKKKVTRIEEGIHILKSRPGTVGENDFVIDIILKGLCQAYTDKIYIKQKPREFVLWVMPYHPVLDPIVTKIMGDQEVKAMTPSVLPRNLKIMTSFCYNAPSLVSIWKQALNI